MDELKLTTKFMRGLVARIIRTVIRNKLGYDVDIQLNELQVTAKDGKIHLHASVDGELTNEELTRIIKTIGI